MTVNAAINALLTAECNIHNLSVSTGDLGNKKAGYSSTPTISAQACQIRPFGAGRRTEGMFRGMAGLEYDDYGLLVVPDSCALTENAQVVQTKGSDGTALSATQQARNTFIVKRVMDALKYAGCNVGLLTQHGRNT